MKFSHAIRFILNAVKVAVFLLIICDLACATGTDQSDAWQLDGFARPPDAKPVIVPKRDSVFVERPGSNPVLWEALHTFNPAAIVRRGKIYVLYRAEDDSGENKIGGHASRIGLAQSRDGIHFERQREPVLYPSDDDQKPREEKGGCEDPRIVETENGSYVMTYTQWNHSTYDTAVASSSDLRQWTKT